MPEFEKIELFFSYAYATAKKTRYNEEIGDHGWSERDVAIGYIYPLTEAVEMIGSPQRLKVTIEPA